MKSLIVALAIAAATPVVAQTPTAPPASDSLRAAIHATVRDSLGLPIEGASVLISPGGLILRTDSAGTFTARATPVGRLTINVRRLGMAPLETQVTVRVGADTTLDLVMRRLPQRLAEVEVRVEANRQCNRFSLEGILCRREAGKGLFVDRGEILAINPVYLGDILRDKPGFRVAVNKTGRIVIPTAGWRCMVVLADGNQTSRSNPIPRVRDVFAVEVYQPDEAPPEYQHWVWRGAYPCTLVIYWSNRVGAQRLKVGR